MGRDASAVHLTLSFQEHEITNQYLALTNTNHRREYGSRTNIERIQLCFNPTQSVCAKPTCQLRLRPLSSMRCCHCRGQEPQCHWQLHHQWNQTEKWKGPKELPKGCSVTFLVLFNRCCHIPFFLGPNHASMQQPPQNVEISNEGNHVKNQKSEFCAYTSVRKIPTAQNLVAELYKLRKRDDSQLSKITIAGNMRRHTDMQVRAPQETHSNLVKTKTG